MSEDDERRILGKAQKIQAAWNNGFPALSESLLEGVYNRWGPSSMAMCMGQWADSALRARGWEPGLGVPPFLLLNRDTGEEREVPPEFDPKAEFPFGPWFGANWIKAHGAMDRERADELLALATAQARIPEALTGVLETARTLIPLYGREPRV